MLTWWHRIAHRSGRQEGRPGSGCTPGGGAQGQVAAWWGLHVGEREIGSKGVQNDP